MKLLATAFMAGLAAAPALALAEGSATATLAGPDGGDRGAVELQATPSGVLIHAVLRNLPPGVHGFHIHETGSCRPDFSAAGGHFAPDGNKHGSLTDGGPHAGDMPNIHVPESGELTFEALNARVSLERDAKAALLGEDGTAIVIHKGPDDYSSQPSGAAGDRIACGVIR